MTTDEEMSDADTMTLTEHLAELRVRIIRSALAVAIGMVLIIAFYDQVLDFLLQPYVDLCERKPQDFCDPELFIFSPTEGSGHACACRPLRRHRGRAARAALADLAVHRPCAQREGEEVGGADRHRVGRAVPRRWCPGLLLDRPGTRVPHRLGRVPTSTRCSRCRATSR
jgi:hypothetical protein